MSKKLTPELTLVQFPRGKNPPNYSPFCLKLETFLRLSEIPYQVFTTVSLAQAPKKKMPFIAWEGRLIADSSLIIDELKDKKGELIDSHLSESDRSTALAYQRLMEDSIVPALVYFRWQMDDGWEKFSKILFQGAPGFIRLMVGGLLRRKTLRALYMQGMGRHTPGEVLEILEKDLEAVSRFLDEKKFFFGNQPTTLDCVGFGVLGNLFGLGSPSPVLTVAQRFPSLQAYVTRIQTLFDAQSWVCVGQIDRLEF